jgi:phosphatidylglycerol:prolipoprotein diacylglycerol transferase
MYQTLFHIHATVGGYPVFGFGLLLALWAVASVLTLVLLARRQGFNADTWGYVPILLLIGAIIAWVLPAICEQSPSGVSLGLPIRGYGVMMLLAVVSGTLLAAWRAKRVGVDPDLIFTLIFWMLVPGIIGARAFHVIEYWQRDYWPAYGGKGGSLGALIGEIVNVTHGGLVVYGSFFGGMLGVLLFVRKYHAPLLALGDLIAPSMLLGLAIGRVGCLLNGCCFGGVCDHRWAIEFPAESPAYVAQIRRGQMYGFDIGENPDAKPCVVRKVTPGSPADAAKLHQGDRLLSVNDHRIDTTEDAQGALLKAFSDGHRLRIEAENRPATTIEAVNPPPRSLPVEPSQPLSTIDALLLCLLLLAYDPFRRRDGELFALMMSIYPITRFLIEFLRSDEAAVLNTGLSIGQCVSLLLLVCAAVLWRYVLSQPKGTAFSRNFVPAADGKADADGASRRKKLAAKK